MRDVFPKPFMPSDILPSIEIETASHPTASVMWLQGLGGEGNDFVPVVPEIKLPATLALRFLFPHAPVRKVTINNGMAMRAWYDIDAADLFFFSSRRRHTRLQGDWSSDVCSSD